MASYCFDKGIKALVTSKDWTASTVEVLALGSSFSGDKATAGFYTDCTLGELSGTGYAGGYGGSGRKVLANTAILLPGSNLIQLDADDVTWSAISAGTIAGLLVGVKGASSDATAVPLAFIDLTDTPTNGGDITIQWSSSGVIEFNNA